MTRPAAPSISGLKPFPRWAYVFAPLLLVLIPVGVIIALAIGFASLILALPVSVMCDWFGWEEPQWVVAFGW